MRAGAILASVLFVLGSAVAVERWKEQRAARILQPPGRLVDIGARKVHVLCTGSGSPTVLLEASGVGNSLQYQRILPALGRETTTCTYDRAGMGFSEPASGPRSAQNMVDDLIAALAAASVPGPFVLVAGSLGGLVAELFSREHPHEVAGFVALDALTTETVDNPVVRALASKACLGRWAAELGLLRLTDPFGLATSDPLAFEVTYRASTWRTICRSLTDLSETSLQLRAAPPLRADLPLTVVVHGEPRGLLPMASAAEERAAEPGWIAAQQAFAARSTRGRLVVAAGSGHLIAQERPDLVVAEVKDVVAETRRGP